MTKNGLRFFLSSEVNGFDMVMVVNNLIGDCGFFIDGISITKIVFLI